MTARSPTGALLYPQGVVRTTDQQPATGDLLEVAFETQVGIAHGQQLGVNSPMRAVANGAPFAQGLMLEDIGPALGRVKLR